MANFNPGHAYRPGERPRTRYELLLIPLLLLGGLLAWTTLRATKDPAQPIPAMAMTKEMAATETPFNIPPLRPEPVAPPAKAEPSETEKTIYLLKQELERQRVRMAQMEHAMQEKPVAETKQDTAKADKKGVPPPMKPATLQQVHFDVKLEEKKPPHTYTLAPWATKLPCVVETQVNSDVEGPITAKLTTAVYDTQTGEHLLIPQGSTLGGHYDSKGLLYGNERLSTWTTELTLPNGTVVEVGKVPLLDLAGTAGLASRVDSHFWRLASAVLITSVLKGSTETVRLGTAGASAGVSEIMANQVASGANQVGTTIMRPYVDARPTIHVDAGELCTVILTKELSLAEYRP